MLLHDLVGEIIEETDKFNRDKVIALNKQYSEELLRLSRSGEDQRKLAKYDTAKNAALASLDEKHAILIETARRIYSEIEEP